MFLAKCLTKPCVIGYKPRSPCCLSNTHTPSLTTSFIAACQELLLFICPVLFVQHLGHSILGYVQRSENNCGYVSLPTPECLGSSRTRATRWNFCNLLTISDKLPLPMFLLPDCGQTKPEVWFIVGLSSL